MARKSSSSSSCAFCEKSNLASICASCVNYRVNEYSTPLKYLQNKRDLLYRRLEVKLLAKKKLDDQCSWRMLQNEKIAKLRERLNSLEEQLTKDKAMVSTVSNDLKARHEELESSFAMIAQKRVEMLESCQKFNHGLKLQNMAITDELLQIQAVIIKQICELFPMQRVNSEGKEKDGSGASYHKICNARLPRGLDPHSVSAEELAASLGYMVQLLNLVIPNLAAPALHNSGFAGSCSRIWQRNSYWDARPSSRSKEYPLFILHQNFCSSGVDISWSDRSSSNFGVALVESDRKPYLGAGSSSFNYSFASSHSVEIHIDLQKGISLLKKSVACITAYVNDSLGLNISSEVSTFEAFARLLVALSSQEKMKSVSLKIANPRSDSKARKLNNSVWNASSTTSSSLEESTDTVGMPSARDNISKLVTSFLYSAETTDCRKSDCLADEWDLVEHPTLPPPPSQVENVEHWTRAMFIDVTQ